VLDCESDAECDDGLACNGDERCAGGSCESGEAVACTGAALGCEAVCQEHATGPRCVTRAADSDGDGHGSATCAAFPGDDCNDHDASVHAGAPERCDASDNDCDGTTDLSDGLSLESASITLEGVSPSVAWSPHQGAFGLTWVGRSEGASQILGGTVSTSGVLEPWSDVPFSSTTAAYLSPVLLDTGSGFVALYQTGSRGGQLSHLAIIGSNGTAQTIPLDGLHADLARVEPGVFLFAGELMGSLTIEMVPAAVAESSSFDSSPISPRIAAVGSNAAVIWQVENSLDVRGLLYLDGQFVEPSFGNVQGAASPDITAMGDGYAAAWSSSNGVFYQRLNVDGGLPCIGSDVPLPIAALSDRSVAIAGTDGLAFVLVTDRANNIVHLLRFDDACRLIDRTEIEVSDVPSRPAIAAGGGHVAACWSEGTGDDHSECRVMGVELCEGAAGAGQ
jgi:hypothetical protein